MSDYDTGELTAMEFPLIEHELGLLGRRKSTYVLRVIPIVIVVTLMLISNSLYGSFARINDQFAETVKAFIFGCGLYVQQAIVLLFTPIVAAGTIAREKQDRTIVFLTLANFRGSQVYFSKAFSVCLQTGVLALLIVPVLISGVSLGGIELQEVLWGELRVASLIVFTAAVGMFSSTVASRPTDAVAMTYAAVLGFMIFSAFVYWQLSVFLPIEYQSEPYQRLIGYVVVPLVIAAVLIVANVRLLSRASSERVAKAARKRKRRAVKVRASGIAAVYRGAVQSLGSAWLNPRRRWIVMLGGGVAIMFLEWMSPVPIAWVLLFIIAYEIVSTIESSQRQDTFDTLAVTPATERAFANALVGVHFARSLVFFPGLAAGSVFKWYVNYSMFGLIGQDVGTAGMVTAIAIAIFVDVVFLGFVVVASCYAATLKSAVAWRMAFVAFIYFLLSIGGYMLVVMFSMFFMYEDDYGFAWMQIFTPLGSALLMLLVGFEFYRALTRRIRRQWRNGGVSRAIVNPVGV